MNASVHAPPPACTTPNSAAVPAGAARTGAGGSTIIPCLRYRDAAAAIDWLCTAFGFQPHAIYRDGDVIRHAQLVCGGGMVMIGSAGLDGPWGRLVAQPADTGLRVTQGNCVVVPDVDAHYARAVAAGAVVAQGIADQGYGGRGYACRDLEGHLWWFGSSDPWAK